MYSSSAAVQFLCIAEIFGVRLVQYYNEEGYTCSLSTVKTSARVIAIAKLTLEPLVHVVYSIGASTRNKAAHRIQYVALALIASTCMTITFQICSKSMYLPNCLDYLFSTVPLESAVSEIAGRTHVSAVSIFGFLETLRCGTTYPWEGNMPASLKREKHFVATSKTWCLEPFHW